MTGLSCLTFVFVAFSCYAMSLSKLTRNEPLSKVELMQQQHQRQQQQQQQQQPHQPPQSEATYETRQKRSQLDVGNGGLSFGSAGEYKDLNEFIEELGDNAIVPVSQEMDLENMPPLLYFMLLQKLKQLQTNERQLPTRRTPRLGRSIDFQLFDAGAGAASTTGHDFDVSSAINMANDYAVSRQFLPRVMKKSVQFKPRLGKRTQVCD